MSRDRQLTGRGLDPFEVALIKRMDGDGFPRDRIMSFFIRPGRVLTPAAVSEIRNGKFGAEVEPATVEETHSYIARRMNEVRSYPNMTHMGPVSPTRVREVLRLSRDAQGLFVGFENHLVEYKSSIPNSQSGYVKTAKTLASFANSRGGYIFFGIDDQRNFVGLPERVTLNAASDSVSQNLNRLFSPAIQWQQAVVSVEGHDVFAIYAYEAERKPVIAVADCTAEVKKGCIYARYGGITSLMEPADVLTMLADRDRKTVAEAVAVATGSMQASG